MRPIRLSSLLLVLSVSACSGATSTPAAPVVTSVPVVSVPEPSAATPEPVAVPKPEDPFAALPPSLPTTIATGTKPAPVKRSGKAWPFHAWDRAEAVVMNWAPYGPTSQMHAYDGERGWSPLLAYRAPLDAELAKRSVDLALEEGGELVTTKCPIPRHAVVLFDGDTAVASINVDLTCRNVLLWPQWPAKAQDAMGHKLALEFIPRWHTLFADDLHFPMWDAKKGP